MTNTDDSQRQPCQDPSPRILVADDEEMVRNMLAVHLGQQGYEVAKTPDGRAALELFKERHFDLIISDVRMPGLDGLELLRAVKDIDPRVLVIIISGHGDMETIVEALKSGAENFLPKPLKLSSLTKVVKQALDLRCPPPPEQTPLPCVHQITRMECASRPEAVSEVVHQVALSAVAVGFAQRDLDNNIKLAVSEAITNAMEHGNRWDPAKTVKVVVEANFDSLEVSIEDQGPGFDVAGQPDPTDQTNLTRERGRGVFLIRSIMDEVDYMSPGNRVILRKHKAPARDQD